MITFKQFISESGDDVYMLRNISVEQALAWVTKHAPKSLASMQSSDTIFYRGGDYRTDMGLIDSRKFNRKAANTYNTYTIWIDNAPQWKGFPKRSQGLVCSTSRSIAHGYARGGAPYIVIPSDKADVGISGVNDFWVAFPLVRTMGGHDLDDFVRDVHRMIRAVINADKDDSFVNRATEILDGLESKESITHVSFESLEWLLKNVTREKMADAVSYQKHSAIADFYVHAKIFKDMYEMFSTVLDPNETDVTAAHAPDAIREADVNNEVWVSGECLLIHEEEFYDLSEFSNKSLVKIHELIFGKKD